MGYLDLDLVWGKGKKPSLRREGVDDRFRFGRDGVKWRTTQAMGVEMESRGKGSNTTFSALECSLVLNLLNW